MLKTFFYSCTPTSLGGFEIPKKRNFWSDPYWDLDRLDELMESFMNEAFESLKSAEKAYGSPIYYGFSVSVGPDGKPMISEFGNVRPGLEGPELREEISPLVDIMDSNDRVTVFAELPGVDKKEIDLKVSEDSLTISVSKEKRKYYKEVALPFNIKPATAKASYKNGVLEVSLEKAGRPSGKRITVE
ncbi:MAG TPA: Hsp20/alpha crystallin family protein [Candidatus Methanomethylicus sp.]|nr:Hsp20/alpha crystallin family protein [Candidatus Methanomethylicus sp.]HRR55163.1 Hsp20/alpha crystallin family protein [Candidatus Methanomethylicus sp.]HRU80967.1 Hsp20/alpha crystallin family protein [Candidatus Methanomethylicus sp.]